MDAFFDTLGRAVLDRWERAGFSLGQFPAIATAALDERPPAEHVDLAGLMRDFLLDDGQPPQTDSDFGEPEIVAYTHPRFYIQLLFWLDGTTAIHQHAFSGAFHVMAGSSLHAHYAFDDDAAVTPHLHVGTVRCLGMELLAGGRTVPIVSGRGTIHSLFHLETPSVTVVVRTQHDAGTGPQFNYLPPHVAVDPHHHDPLTTRRRQLLDVLERTGDPGYADAVSAMVAALDFDRGFHVLRHAMPCLQRSDEWDEVVAAFEAKHGDPAAGVAATLREEERRGLIKGLRSDVVEPEHRFFLALLMNAPTRDDLLALVAGRHPGEPPEAVVLRWAAELTESSDDGVAILDAAFPETVAVDPDDQPALFVAAFAHFLKRGKRRPAALRGLSAEDVDDLRAAFAGSILSLLTV